ncbi:MAG: endonuclease [Chloroflexi bacterium]|nr:endonuclease [Chloroflexota bacterium]
MRKTVPRPSIPDVVAALERMHGEEHWHWTPQSDPFEVAAGAILVQHTSWTNAERAVDNLREAGILHPRRLAALPDEAVEELIRPSGQYRTKARKLRAFLELVARHGSVGALLALPPDTLRQQLLATWGIGPETADAIALYAAGYPAVVVDAYTRRLFSRLALGPSPDASYASWQAYLADALPADAPALARFHALVVLHGKRLCLARRPRCGWCELAPRCAFAAAPPLPP